MQAANNFFTGIKKGSHNSTASRYDHLNRCINTLKDGRIMPFHLSRKKKGKETMKNQNDVLPGSETIGIDGKKAQTCFQNLDIRYDQRKKSISVRIDPETGKGLAIIQKGTDIPLAAHKFYCMGGYLSKEELQVVLFLEDYVNLWNRFTDKGTRDAIQAATVATYGKEYSDLFALLNDEL